jgi:hypothetical protein
MLSSYKTRLVISDARVLVRETLLRKGFVATSLYPLSLYEKHKMEMRPYEERRLIDYASPSSHLTL